MSPIPPTYSFPLGPRPNAAAPSAPAPTTNTTPGAPNANAANPIAPAERAAASVDTVELSGGPKRLVAARVVDQVEFTPAPTEAPASPATGAMPIYRHPADMNAAATGVELGSRLDVTG